MSELELTAEEISIRRRAKISSGSKTPFWVETHEVHFLLAEMDRLREQLAASEHKYNEMQQRAHRLGSERDQAKAEAQKYRNMLERIRDWDGHDIHVYEMAREALK